MRPFIKRSFRVKGKLDSFKVKTVALMPTGNGNFIMPFNAAMRKAQANEGATINVILEVDDAPLQLNEDFTSCLNDDPRALAYFSSLAAGHRNYLAN